MNTCAVQHNVSRVRLCLTASVHNLLETVKQVGEIKETSTGAYIKAKNKITSYNAIASLVETKSSGGSR